MLSMQPVYTQCRTQSLPPMARGRDAAPKPHPLPRWTHGSITLLGDAGHPMMPIGSNGASQAILDARVLTGCLRRYEDDPEHALERYDAIRREATSAIVLANRGQGPEYPMQLVEERAPHGFANLHDVVSAEELRAIADKYGGG
jgi:2-polyprenyl-6-methoxyphenol hydroxylase-like FAD-dependent oxidoreductase